MKRLKRPKYLAWMRTLPCVICQNDVTTEAAHVRMKIISLNKPITGMGKRPGDWWTLPLCHFHHEWQHNVGEANFWGSMGHSPADVGLMCLALWQVQFDAQAASDLIRIWNEWRIK